MVRMTDCEGVLEMWVFTEVEGSLLLGMSNVVLK